MKKKEEFLNKKIAILSLRIDKKEAKLKSFKKNLFRYKLDAKELSKSIYYVEEWDDFIEKWNKESDSFIKINFKEEKGDNFWNILENGSISKLFKSIVKIEWKNATIEEQLMYRSVLRFTGICMEKYFIYYFNLENKLKKTNWKNDYYKKVDFIFNKKNIQLKFTLKNVNYWIKYKKNVSEENNDYLILISYFDKKISLFENEKNIWKWKKELKQKRP